MLKLNVNQQKLTAFSMKESARWNLTEAQKQFVQLIQAVRENPQLITDDQRKVIAF